MEKIKVKFLKAMYPYRAGDIGFVKQSILDTYPKYVEKYTEPKTKEAKKVGNKMQTRRKNLRYWFCKAIKTRHISGIRRKIHRTENKGS